MTARAFVLMLSGLLLAGGVARALPVTDDRGVQLALAQPPQRIVSLLPSLTETVCALGQCQRLVGVDRYSNYPDFVRNLPQVGGGLDPNIEAIAALKPDLVLMATSTPVADRLQSLGIKVLALEPKSHADVQRALQIVGRVLEVSDAERVWREIDTAVLATAQAVPLKARALRIYFEVNSAPYAAGEASFIGETLKRLGVRNMVPASLGVFPKLNPEFVVRENPDLIMVGDRNFIGLQGRPGWQRIRAIREGRVCVFTAEQTDVLVRAGPRMAEGARLMLKCLQDKAA